MTEIKKNPPFSLWLIGPSAAGKTTISKKIFSVLSKKYKSLVILDGDHGRKIFFKDSQIKFFFGVIIFSIIVLTLYFFRVISNNSLSLSSEGL